MNTVHRFIGSLIFVCFLSAAAAAVSHEGIGDSGKPAGVRDNCPDLGPVNIVFPRDMENYSLINTPARLEWTAVTNADYYDVYLEKDNPSPSVQVAESHRSTSLVVEALEPGTWYWKVVAFSDCGGEKTGKVWSFTITNCSKVNPVSLLSPEKCSTYTTSRPLKALEWGVVSNASRYNVWLEKNDDTPDVMVAEGISGNSLAVQGLTEGAWFWRITACNDCDDQESEVRRFNILDDGPPLSDAETVLYFPQFINGEGADTEFLLVNNCSEATNGSIIYYSNDLTGSGGIIRTEPYSIQAGEVLVKAWLGSPGSLLQVGAVEITQEGDTFCRIEGTEFFNALGSYTTVNGADLLNTQQVFALRGTGRNTGFAVFNPNEYEIGISVIFRSGGEELAAEIELGAKGHRAMFLDELLPEVPEGAAGTLNFTAAEGDEFALMGLLLVDPVSNALVALPVIPVID